MPQISSSAGNIPPGPVLTGGKATKTRKTRKTKKARKTNKARKINRPSK